MKERPNHRPMPRLVTIFLLLLAQVVWAAVIPSAHAGAPEALYPPRDHSQDLDIPAPAFRRGELLVKFEDNGGIIATPGRQTLARAGAQRLHGEREASDGRAAELWQVEVGQELALATRLSALPDVAYAEPNYLVYAHLTPNDPLYNPQWAHNVIGSEGAWDLSTGSGSIVVAVVDTGVDLDNPELQGRVTGGKSFVPGVSSPDDDQGHGTHVAGIIAAAGNNGLGVAGMAWSAQIMPIKVLDATGVGDSSDVAHGIRYAVDNGAHILNISLGGPGASTTLYEAVQYASNNGVLVVGSAGNCGDGNYAKNGCDYENQVIYPAAYDAEVLAVAATNTYDTVASFSNQGSYVDVAAPGVGILSTIPTGYAYADGTSQAAPFVAGLAALLLSVKPSLTPPQVEAIISATAVDLGPTGWDPNYGAGRINAVTALAQAIGLQTPELYAIANPDRDESFLVDWSEVAEATSYSLQRDDTINFGSPVMQYAGSDSQTTITSHPTGTWYYRVRAEQAGGLVTSDWSAPQNVIVGLDTPTAPGFISDGTNTYTVTWDSVIAATAYRLQESQAPDFSGATTYEIGNALSYGVVDQEGGTWHYRVQAYNATIAGAWGEGSALTVVPQAPTLLPLVTGVVSDAYTLTWSSVPGADGYRVQEASAPDFQDANTRYLGPGTVYEVTGQPGGDWIYRVQAYNAAGYSAASNAKSITVPASPVPAPVLQPIVDDDRDGTFAITWSPVTSATGYILEESATPWFESPAVAYTGSEARRDVIEQPLGMWFYRVRARAEESDSPWSAPQSIFVADYVFLPLVMRTSQP